MKEKAQVDELEKAVEIMKADIGERGVDWDIWLAMGRYELRDRLYEMAAEAASAHVSKVKALSALQPPSSRHYYYSPYVKIRGWNVDVRWIKFGYEGGMPKVGRKPKHQKFDAKPAEETQRIAISHFRDAEPWEKECIAECELAFAEVRSCKKHLYAINMATRGLKEWLGFPSIDVPPGRQMRVNPD